MRIFLCEEEEEKKGENYFWLGPNIFRGVWIYMERQERLRQAMAEITTHGTDDERAHSKSEQTMRENQLSFHSSNVYAPLKWFSHARKSRGEVQVETRPAEEDVLEHEGSISKERTRQNFSAFLKLRQDRILGTATRVLRNRDDAFDVLQEVSLTIYKRWDELNTSLNIEGWLYRVTINECYRWLRKKPKSPNELESAMLEALPASAPHPEEQLRTKEFQAFLAQALELLSAQERMAFVLRDLEQHPGKEIANMMECQATTARGYYFAARKKLAAHIKTSAPEWLSLLGKGESV